MSGEAPRRPLRRGNLVRVKSAEEIVRTLNSDGTLDGLPFMPEMLEYCGRQFHVYHRVVQCVIDAAHLSQLEGSFVRRFEGDNVVVLDNVRCSGTHHGGCQRGCSLFWKTAWLEPLEKSMPQKAAAAGEAPCGASGVEMKLRTRQESGRYFCQSSELPKVTRNLTAAQRILNCFRSVIVGNESVWTMLKLIGTWTYWRIRKGLFGVYPRGTQRTTPTEMLGLRPGELVEVKSLEEIVATLNRRGRNRGLHFSEDQRLHCGRRFRVRSRAEKLIAEGTGEMKRMENTVILEDAICDSSHYSFGGCSRRDLQYWREIWLRRVAVGTECGGAAPHAGVAARRGYAGEGPES